MIPYVLTSEGIFCYLDSVMPVTSSKSPRSAHRIQFLALKLLLGLLRLLPRRGRGATGVCLGKLAYYSGIRKRVVKENLKEAFPDLPPQGVSEVARSCFEHFGCVATSLAAFPSLTKATVNDWVFFENLAALDAAVAGGKGGLVISGHIGNWEIVGAMCGKLGYPVSFVVTTQRNKLVEAWLNELRESCGIEIIQRKDALRGVLSALKRNRLVAILIDQDAHEEGVFVPFFGKLSSTPRGPAVFHQRTGAPLIFMSSYRLPGERYKCRLETIEVAPEADHAAIMAALTLKLETAIRQAPEQWFWMHRRWKTAPPESLS